MSGSSVSAVLAATRLINEGLTLTSTGTPTLNGTYSCTGLSAAGLQAEANALMLSGTTPVFADGTTSLNWPDSKGAGHTFTPAQFLELVHAIDLFLSQCAQYAAGVTTSPPSNAATIP